MLQQQTAHHIAIGSPCEFLTHRFERASLSCRSMVSSIKPAREGNSGMRECALCVCVRRTYGSNAVLSSNSTMRGGLHEQRGMCSRAAWSRRAPAKTQQGKEIFALFYKKCTFLWIGRIFQDSECGILTTGEDRTARLATFASTNQGEGDEPHSKRQGDTMGIIWKNINRRKTTR